MTNPHEEGRGVSVTIKAPESKRYASDNTWLVFHGSVEAVREDVLKAFSMEDTGLSLSDVALEAQKVFTATASLVHGGGKVLSSGSATSPSAGDSVAPVGSSEGDVWAQAAAARANGASTPAEPEADPILTAIEGCTTVAELQQVWAENQESFNTNDAYMSAYKARGKALTAA